MIFIKRNEKHDNRVRTSWLERWIDSGHAYERSSGVFEELWKISKQYGPHIAH